MSDGEISVTNATGTTTLNLGAGQTLQVQSFFTDPGQPIILSTAEINNLLGGAIGAAPPSPGGESAAVPDAAANDQEVEGDETFAAVLSPVINAQIGDGTATGTILNDDVALSGGTLTIAIGTEGSENPGNATFIVTRSGTTAGTVTVNFATTSGTATSGTDFTATSGTLTFASGVASQTITVPVLADTNFENHRALHGDPHQSQWWRDDFGLVVDRGPHHQRLHSGQRHLADFA